MSQETHPAATHASTDSVQAIPKNLPVELLPAYDWFKTNGSQALITLLIAVIVLGGGWAFKQHRESQVVGANQALLQASSVEDLEAAVAKYGSIKAGNALRLRLAKAYFDAGNYDGALENYDACLKKGAPAGFSEIARLGRAEAFEALNRLDEALSAYEAFSASTSEPFLAPQAEMGIARVYALQGKKDEAKKRLETLKAKKTDDARWEMAIANLEGVIDRYEPRAARSLFDTADAAAQALQQEKATAQKPEAPAVPAAPETK